MGKEDSLQAALAHAVLSVVAGNGVGRYGGRNFTSPGMHSNLFIHGLVGFFHHQSSILNNDFEPLYKVTYLCTTYLPLPCLMADLYFDNKPVSTAFIASGVLPLVLALTGEQNMDIRNLVLAINVLALAHYSFDRGLTNGWFATGAAIFTYFCTPVMAPNVCYPIGLAVMDYFVSMIHDSGSAAPTGGRAPAPARR